MQTNLLAQLIILFHVKWNVICLEIDFLDQYKTKTIQPIKLIKAAYVTQPNGSLSEQPLSDRLLAYWKIIHLSTM